MDWVQRMPELTFSVKASLESFLEWLRDELPLLTERRYPTGGRPGRSAELWVEPPAVGASTEAALGGLMSSLDGSDVEPFYWRADDLRFKVMERGPEEVEVVAFCKDPEHMPLLMMVRGSSKEALEEYHQVKAPSTERVNMDVEDTSHAGPPSPAARNSRVQPEAEEEPTPQSQHKVWKYPDIVERDNLIKSLFEKGVLYWQIAIQANCSLSTVKRTLKEYGLRRRKV